MNMKLAMAPPLFLLAVGHGLSTYSSIVKEDYSEVAFTGTMSFLFFHFGLAVMKYGMQPYRVVPGIYLLAGTYVAWGIHFVTVGNWADAAMQFIASIVWAWSAKQANKVRRKKELEARAKDL